MNKERFVEIFVEVLGDTESNREWAEISWNKVPEPEKTALTDTEVKQAAVDWKRYGDEGGF